MTKCDHYGGRNGAIVCQADVPLGQTELGGKFRGCAVQGEYRPAA
jgi:hypothetical protein